MRLKYTYMYYLSNYNAKHTLSFKHGRLQIIPRYPLYRLLRYASLPTKCKERKYSGCQRWLQISFEGNIKTQVKADW